jgi:homoserine dehydrogenase
MEEKEGMLALDYGLDLMLVGAVDSTGAVSSSTGLDPAQLRRVKQQSQGLATIDLPEAVATAGVTGSELLTKVEADCLLEASPTDLQTGGAGLATMQTALRAGLDVVSANKGPLVVAYNELADLARKNGAALKFSAAVATACPTVNIGQRDLVGCKIECVDGIFNLTTNYVLCQMAEEGLAFEEALAQAQAQGIAEADPTLDVDGWDAAAKLVILANSVLKMPATLEEVQVEGIRDVSVKDLDQARAQGAVIKLVASARVNESNGYRLEVKPQRLDASHMLADLKGDQLGIVYHTDIQGTVSSVVGKQGTRSTAAAMLRDLLNIYTDA